MDPVALWEEIVDAADAVIRGLGPKGRRFEILTEVESDAYDMATRVQDLNEWVQKGGFSPFEKGV